MSEAPRSAAHRRNSSSLFAGKAHAASGHRSWTLWSEMLERTRLLDDAGRFERAWHALRERAAESVVPEICAPGYRQVAALGERLAVAEGLEAQAKRAVAEWREIDTAQTALADELRANPMFSKLSS